jgi:hypothetical protein
VQSIEVLHAGAEAKRHLRVRFGAFSALSNEALAGLGELVHPLTSGREAVFAVADDAGATSLLTSLLKAGMPVVEARSEEGRLERLFLEAPQEARP